MANGRRDGNQIRIGRRRSDGVKISSVGILPPLQRGSAVGQRNGMIFPRRNG
jgi:hypothetical protein